MAAASSTTSGSARVWVDGGICRGTDIVKARALGAEAVGIGRLYCYGLAAAGAPGIVRLLEILEEELAVTMGLLGVSALDQLDASYLHRGAPAVATPSALSAFPLLGPNA